MSTRRGDMPVSLTTRRTGRPRTQALRNVSRICSKSCRARSAAKRASSSGVRFESGDVTLSAEGTVTPKTEHLYLEPIAEAIEPDEAYGEDWFAYRLDGRTRLLMLGANVPLSQGVSLDVELQQGVARIAGLNYDRWLGSVSLLKRF